MKAQNVGNKHESNNILNSVVVRRLEFYLVGILYFELIIGSGIPEPLRLPLFCMADNIDMELVTTLTYESYSIFYCAEKRAKGAKGRKQT